MPIDPQAQASLDQAAALNEPPMYTLTPEELRQSFRTTIPMLGEPEPVALVENRTIPGPAGEIPLRIYIPEGNSPFPVFVYFHGGGWVGMDLDTHDSLCRSLANGAGCVVVAVAYRLAPEHKFPAASEDCYAATAWIASHTEDLQGDPKMIAIGGDSVGGTLTAVATQMARAQNGPKLLFQILIYPVTDCTMQSASMEELGEGYGLTKQDMIWFINHYLNTEADKTNPLASPLYATDLKELPPALIITAEYDPLRDEGEAYGHKLKEAGVSVTISRYDGMIHGFVRWPNTFDGGKRAIEECCQALRAAFAATQ
jgi:acetyl esterase/lipase